MCVTQSFQIIVIELLFVVSQHNNKDFQDVSNSWESKAALPEQRQEHYAVELNFCRGQRRTVGSNTKFAPFGKEAVSSRAIST